MNQSSKVRDGPLVSVIMPVYNCATYVTDALESIADQSYHNLEIVVVDDCSTDGTWKIVQEYAKRDSRFKPFRNDENLKIVGTLNRAIRESHGKYLARMDGDDIRLPDSIAKEVTFLEAHPEVVVVGGAILVCNQNMVTINKRSYPQEDSDIRKKIFKFSPYAHGSIMMRKEVLEIDPYKYNWAEDYDLYFRLGIKGEFANLPDVLYQLRTYPQSVSRTKARYQEKLTLYIRLKAVMEYGYSMTFADKIYFAAQLATMYLMSPSFRFWLFNKFRAS